MSSDREITRRIEDDLTVAIRGLRKAEADPATRTAISIMLRREHDLRLLIVELLETIFPTVLIDIVIEFGLDPYYEEAWCPWCRKHNKKGFYKSRYDICCDPMWDNVAGPIIGFEFEHLRKRNKNLFDLYKCEPVVALPRDYMNDYKERIIFFNKFPGFFMRQAFYYNSRTVCLNKYALSKATNVAPRNVERWMYMFGSNPDVKQDPDRRDIINETDLPTYVEDLEHDDFIRLNNYIRGFLPITMTTKEDDVPWLNVQQMQEDSICGFYSDLRKVTYSYEDAYHIVIYLNELPHDVGFDDW